MDSSALSPLALIAGPTASGKSALALDLATKWNGTVINADSAQVYRDLRVLSARPTAAEESRIPHRLYGYRDGGNPCSAADWAKDAKQSIEEAWARGSLPIVAGGTGLYLRTLLDGIAPVPPIDPQVRAEVRSIPVPEAFEALQTEDPQSAEKLRPTDRSRVARALEVVRSTGRPLGEWQKQREGGIASRVRLVPFVLLPPRQWLYDRCDRRFETMMGEAAIEEVRCLLDRKLSPSLPVMRAIGVQEIAALVEGRLKENEAVEAAQIATRQYAKRQYTWFKHQLPASWTRFEEPLDGVEDVERAAGLFERELDSSVHGP